MTDIYTNENDIDIYGDDIHPNRFGLMMNGLKAKRTHVKTSHTPSTRKPGEEVIIGFENLTKNDVIVPGSFFISGKLEVTSTKDKARYIVNNIGRKLIKTLKIKFRGNIILCMENYDVLKGYFDLFLSKYEKAKRVYQGIQSVDGLKLHVDSNGATGTSNEVAIKSTLGNRFMIPIDFELLNDIGPFYQAGLEDQLSIELTFNDPSAVILGSTSILAAASDSDYSYQFTNIEIEYDTIKDQKLANIMASQYQLLTIPYKRYHHYHTMEISKTLSKINIEIKSPSKSLTHVLILAIDPNDRKKYAHNENFKNLEIEKVSVRAAGSDNQLYSSGMGKEDTWYEINKYFQDEHEISMGEFLTSKYALCFDFRPTTDRNIHGSGIGLDTSKRTIKIDIERTPATSGTEKLNLMIFLIEDAKLNFSGWKYHSVEH